MESMKNINITKNTTSQPSGTLFVPSLSGSGSNEGNKIVLYKKSLFRVLPHPSGNMNFQIQVISPPPVQFSAKSLRPPHESSVRQISPGATRLHLPQSIRSLQVANSSGQMLPVLRNNQVTSQIQHPLMHPPTSINSISNTAHNAMTCSSNNNSNSSAVRRQAVAIRSKKTDAVTPTPYRLQTPHPVELSKTPPSNNELKTNSLLTCEICDARAENPEILRTHMQLTHEVKIHPQMMVWCKSLSCTMCERRFFTDQGLERHVLCAHGLVTSSMQELANRSKDAGTCTICGCVCTSKFVAHMNEIHKVTLKPAKLSYRCKVCSAIFSLQESFENHFWSKKTDAVTPTPYKLQTPHPVELSKTPPSNNELKTNSLLTCEICDARAENPERLRTHMQLTHEVKIHPQMMVWCKSLCCTMCERRFFTDQGLERHVLCAHGLVTSSMQELANRSKDAGSCIICGCVCTSKFVAHMNEIHKATLKPANLSYRCKVCSAIFSIQESFENHFHVAHRTGAKRQSDSNVVLPSRKCAKLSHSDFISVCDKPAESPSGKENEDADRQILPVLGSSKVVASPKRCFVTNAPTSVSSSNTECSSQAKVSRPSERLVSTTPTSSKLHCMELSKTSSNNQLETDSSVICEICDARVNSLKQLSLHMHLKHKIIIRLVVLEGHPNFRCQRCQRRFFLHLGLERHLLCAHGLITPNMQDYASRNEDAGRCIMCGVMCHGKIVAHLLEFHRMNLEEVNCSYKCSRCSDTFKLYSLLVNHNRQVHTVTAKRSSGNNDGTTSEKNG